MQNKECCTPQKNRINYQKELEKLLASLEAERISGNGKKKRLLLHACCAPCSSYVLEYLREKFEITVLYYNPNITEREEYEKRSAELKRLARQMNQESAGAGQPEKGSVPTEPAVLPSGFILVEEGEETLETNNDELVINGAMTFDTSAMSTDEINSTKFIEGLEITDSDGNSCTLTD